MYKKPIAVREDDPICSATTLGNTVVGILFDKTGAQIRQALEARIGSIRDEEQSYAELAEPLRGFLRDKEDEIARTEAYEKERLRKRTKALENDREKLDKAVRAMQKIVENEQEKVDVIADKLDKAACKFDEATVSELEAREKSFADGWGTIKQHLEAVKSFESERKWSEPVEAREIKAALESSNSSTSGMSTSSCSKAYGVTGPAGDTYRHGVSTGVEDGETKISVSARLRQRHSRYMRVFDDIKAKLEDLRTERRKLELISRNVDPERSYKLDMNKLSAFGFEDIESE